MTPRVLFYIQHLLGIGHLVRGSRIAAALARAGFAVDLVLGGMPVDGLDLPDVTVVQLPAVRASAGFAELLDHAGQPLGEDARAERQRRLLDLFAERRPDILLIEAFPFGRRQMDFELLPLLESAAARAAPPVVAVSIRDILQRQRKPKRVAETLDIVERFVDAVLVHGDPRLVTLAESFAAAERLAAPLVYTGIVGPEADGSAPLREHDVIVSAGGGAVGDWLIRAALAARPVTTLRDARWLIVTGPNRSDALAADIERLAGPATQIARFVPDLPRRLRGAVLSISQAGYNTVADVLAARCRAVLAPFAGDGETEQADRARLLQARGLAVVVDEASLDGPGVAGAIETALALPEPRPDFAVDGAAATATALKRLLADRGAR